MHLALQGDASAYRELLEGIRPWLMGYFSRRANHAVAEDLTQDTLMTVHEKRHTYDPSYPFMPWLATVARHRWVDQIRKTAKWVETELDDEMPIQGGEADGTSQRDIEKLLRRLPAAQAKVIELVKIREMSVQQAADLTGHSQSSVKIMIHRGLKRLMADVDDERG